MQPLKITIVPDSNSVNLQIVHFEGDFDGSAPENLVELQKLVEECQADMHLIFDFSGLNYLNSFALSQMVSWQKAVGAKKGQIVISGPNDHIKDIFMVLGVDTIFQTFGTVDEAMKAISDKR